jgi:hypothetical protein
LNRLRPQFLNGGARYERHIGACVDQQYNEVVSGCSTDSRNST